jgi:hypothetical protein
MTLAYSREGGIQKGIRDTFDGKHPCSMCHAMATQQSRPSAQETVLPELKFEVYAPLFCKSDQPVLTFFRQGFRVEEVARWASAHQQPPVPPPQSLRI